MKHYIVLGSCRFDQFDVPTAQADFDRLLVATSRHRTGSLAEIGQPCRWPGLACLDRNSHHSDSSIGQPRALARLCSGRNGSLLDLSKSSCPQMPMPSIATEDAINCLDGLDGRLGHREGKQFWNAEGSTVRGRYSARLRSLI